MPAVTKNEKGLYDAYAWPGGCPIVYYDKSGNVICPDCANELEEQRKLDLLGAMCEWAEAGRVGPTDGRGRYIYDDEPCEVCGAMPVNYLTLCASCDKLSYANDEIDGFYIDESDRAVVCDIYYEGPPVQCDVCSKEIESAYGDPDAEKENLE